MFYREVGNFKSSYPADSQTFPISLDKYGYYIIVFIAFVVIPLIINDYWANAVMVPLLVWAIAALGLNILSGYCGQISLGTGGFMAVGAYSCYKLMTAFPDLNIVFCILLSGIITALVGLIFGIPSLRIKGFYLAVATLASQFFLVWLFNRVPWFYNYSASGQISAPERTIFGIAVTGADVSPWAQYMICLLFAFGLGWAARNLTRGALGRSWNATRDMDIAAEIIGINLLKAKFSAFAISSFYIGISGALFFSVYLGAVEATEAFGINQSFLVLFMVIIGGLGSVLGSFIGAAFMVLFPVLVKNLLVGWMGWDAALATHLEFIAVGSLIILFLILEPHGLAQLWRLTKEKMRLWPYPH
ncbi:MAG: branched-chain amino acid ABC transporter permease [Rhodobacteraceae bacterium]|nr:branched-chain amino acid ABC transporter permease [Paracoccaceae bacterium]